MNIILTCAGRRNYMVDYFKQALAPFGGKVFATNSHGNSTALITADQSFIVPDLYENNYLDVLTQICHQYQIKAIISLFDLELPILARAKERLFTEGIKTVVSSPDVIDICNDKWQTINFLTQNGLQTPLTFLNLRAALEALAAKEVQFPLIIKPRWGMGSIGLLEAEDEDELRLFFAKTKRIIEHSYLATESFQDLEHAVLIQEKLVGQEYGLDVINNLHGEYIATFVKKKIAMRSGETDGAITVDDPELRQLGQKLAGRLGHIANLDVDVFLTENGPYILELNPRFGGGYPFSHLAGANLPAAIVAWLRDETPDTSCFQLTHNVIAFKGIQLMKMTNMPIDMTTGSLF